MRVVFDTNVLFAAFIARSGFCAKVVEDALALHQVFVSPAIIMELRRNLQEKAGVQPGLVEDAIKSILDGCAVVDPLTVAREAVRDPQDAPILGTALAAHADILVTGDKDLLVLGSYQAISILSPRQFHDRLATPRR